MSLIKNILKKILPRPFLKEVFLVYNKFRIRTVDRLLFPEYRIGENQFALYRKGFPFREEGVNVDDIPDEEVRRYMRDWFDWTQEEFILHLDKPCWIEPKYGWAIVEPNKLVYYSLGVSRTWFQPKPDLFGFLKKKKTIRLPKAISLRDTGEENYFHFYNDVLGKIFFLKDRGVDIPQYSLVVSKRLWDKPYFSYYLDHSPLLRSLTWAVQDDEYIKCDSVIFCKPLTHRRDLWDQITAPIKITVPAIGTRKIFLTRNKTRLRFIENGNEIEKICREKGFEVVDTDSLTPGKQVELFSQVSHLVGIHGAGLTNMVFSPGNCKILELFPPPDLGYLPYHYILLTAMRAFRYRALIGDNSAGRFSGGFRVDTDRFTQALSELG